MIDFIKKIKTLHIVLLAAVLTALAFVAGDMYDYMAESSAVKDGSLETVQLHVEDFTLEAIKQVDGGWRTTDTDPQMLYTLNSKFASIYMEMDSLLYTGDVIMYYTNPGDTAYSRQKRIFLVPDESNPGCYTGTLPLQAVENIRIDPTSVGGNVLNFGTVIINPPRTISDYFDITAYTIFMYMVFTALLSGILRFIQEFFTKKYE